VGFLLTTRLFVFLDKIDKNKRKMDKNVLDKIHHKCIIKKLFVILRANTTFYDI